MKRRISCFALLGATIGTLAATEKLAPELQNTDGKAALDVIVQYKRPPAEAHHQRVRDMGGSLKRSLELIQAAQYSIPASQLEALSNDSEVEFVSPDRALAATGTPTYTGNPDYGWRTVGADLATSVLGLDGTGIGVALIDSGINDHDDLKDAQGHNRIVYKASMIPGLSQDDSYGHGDHVAGIIAGNGHKSTGNGFDYLVRGIAPNSTLISLRVLDGNGQGTDSAVIAAIQQAIALKKQYNIRVINLSLGRPVTTSYANDPLCQAVQQAWQAGIVVVIAAGNNGRDNSQGTNGYATITAPGNSPYAITVGAMNTVGSLTPTDDKITSYTSKGPSLLDHIVKPDLVAPGNHIISLNQGGSTLQKQYPGNGVARLVYSTTTDTSAPDYYLLSGTSMAAPMVSGAAALMLQQNPTLTPDQVKARLMKTATKFAPGSSIATDPVTGATYVNEYDIFTIGAGYLNIPAALGNHDVLNGTALSPTATYDAASGNVYIDPTNVAWGSNVTSGSGAVWGGGAVWGTGAVWGSSIFINGSNAVWGSGAVWGTNVSWGSSSPLGFGAVWGTGAVWGGSSTSAEATTIAINGDN